VVFSTFFLVYLAGALDFTYLVSRFTGAVTVSATRSRITFSSTTSRSWRIGGE
jgi:hypothetical protein